MSEITWTDICWSDGTVAQRGSLQQPRSRDLLSRNPECRVFPTLKNKDKVRGKEKG